MSAAPKFTPGPWAWQGYRVLRPVNPRPEKHFVQTILDAADGVWTGTGFAVHGPETFDRRKKEQNANLVLIAAAPELYEALVDCAAVVEALASGNLPACFKPNDAFLARLRAALAKASQP